MSVFFFNASATTEIYTLSLHAALPISAEALLEESDAPVEEIARLVGFGTAAGFREQFTRRRGVSPRADRKSTRLNSSHANISYAVFCLKKKKKDHHYAVYFPAGIHPHV